MVNPEERYDVIVTVPLAAGMEPLNPALATSGPEARPTGTSTVSPSWTSYGDDRALYASSGCRRGRTTCTSGRGRRRRGRFV
ncbi:MAG: hypothetical protein R3F59_20760 [Myxococcota bacterium]